MGFSFLPVLIYEAIFFLAIVIHHSNINISEPIDMLYRKLFSSPLMHRIHHSNKQKETDSNYGSVFSFWDRIFNTYIKKPEAPIIFGVDEKQD
jgi:sterol desaturase/sphingolipid hydroxylase (fatty acid hydroxylase superfamily)